ncbi:MAG: response regulator [Anaerolineae bacterium]|nr:response regulator [Anaerolineae bacterium]
MQKAHLADVLIVDDTPENLKVLEVILGERGYHVRPAPSGRFALQSAAAVVPDIVLLDINMPGMDGYAVCEAFKADPRLRDVPIIFVSALDETWDKLQAFKVGGVDYITKPFDPAEVLARLETQLSIHFKQRQIEQLRAQDRSYYETISRIKDDYLNAVSHDLKTPISSIKTTLYLLRKHGFEDALRAQDYLARIEQDVSRMHQLIDDILELARLETGLALHPAEVALPDFLERTLESVVTLAQQREIHLYLENHTHANAVFDAARLQRALQNLLSNAVKYTEPGGQVTLAAFRQAEHLVFEVQDTGLGIPEADLPHIFARFYRVDHAPHQAIDGTGLGLSIVRAVVQQHNGQVEVESTLGQGSTFRIRLPWLAASDA